ncbi:MAG TPA: DUF4268 domain-containing protein [Flavipsychrobacter sp.]|nr:DUF4268 domain-containing protein [Flavipsychrobacter sp.]
MYSRNEATQLKQEFWTTFGRYMQPVLSAEGAKINWINYKTGISHVSFKMDVNQQTATISIIISHRDKVVRELYYEQFTTLKRLFQNALHEEWIWEKQSDEDGREVSKIYTTLVQVNVFKNEDWPSIISFLKPRIVALDEFWSEARYAFEALQ